MTTLKVTSYPFRSKAQIIAQIMLDPLFALDCLKIMYARQTEYEQDTKTTRDRNRRGFMSSHAVNGSALAVKARNEGLSEEDLSKVQEIVSHYGKQLASHFRQQALEADPTLAAAAALFSAL